MLKSTACIPACRDGLFLISNGTASRIAFFFKLP